MKHLAFPRGFRFAPLFALLFLLLGPAGARAVPVLGVNGTNQLLRFDSAAPQTITATTTVTGLQSGEAILGIDFRPATGQLYALGSTSRLYIVNPSTGAATQVGGPFTPVLRAGDTFGFDFNPVADRIRVVSSTGQNLRLNPDTGTASVDSNLAYAPGDPNAGQRVEVVGAAYTNNFAGATTTTLYGIDWSRGRLVRQGSVNGSPVSPNTGQLFTVGSLNFIQFVEVLGFDIAPDGTAYASIQGTDATAGRLVTINLNTGAATEIGFIGGPNSGLFPRGLAVVPVTPNIFAVTFSNRLLSFNSTAPGSILSSTTITGLQADEKILGIDFRPATGQLYALGSTSRLYTINTTTGAAAQVGSGTFTTALNGNFFGFDFNPSVDRIRVVSDADQNMRLHPDTGAVASVDGPLAYAAGDANAVQNPSVAGSAYSNNTAGASSTILYGIDYDRDSLVIQSPPNNGTLITVGALGVNATPSVGFDIAPGGGLAYAALTPLCFEGCTSALYTVNLTTGAATAIGDIGSVTLSDPVTGIAVAPVGAFEFTAQNYSVAENCTTVAITVRRLGDTSREASVNFSTSDGAGIQPASERSDYNAAFGTLTFAPGETTKTFTVLINEDSIDEKLEADGEFFLVNLSNATGGFSLGSQGSATVTIIDDAAEPSTNAIDDTQTFVCQQYHDFLNRQPDAAGLAFWTNNIESCGANAQCRQVKRIDTSAAFFLSIEFQQTGYVAYRAYKAAFGNVAGTPVPLTIREFLPDVQRLGRGVVIGEPGALDQLEANQRAYFEEFVTRPRFRAQYTDTQSPGEFVDALNANTGGALSQAERDALVAGLAAGTETRATVLRKVVEDADFTRAELNRAFVLEEYFGYLRRNPGDAPDSNFDGYNFWLAKLNQFGGDFRAAEMVKAFITSTEYRQRFGTP
ncbi:MAG TPA: DUF4394 domain-containing protein [Pyrinomonadaceae bacterium]|jgi:hypothetical protein|nr:DUF4394 domain-containing protein [Pyrinomonadaceae bacterium]